MSQVLNNSIDIQDSINHRQLATLQANVPIVTNFLIKCPKIANKLPVDVCEIIRYIFSTVDSTFSATVNPPTSYQPCTTSDQISYFPALPIVRGQGKYKADENIHTHQEDDCRKASYGHPTLTPGIFTVYCPHGICYGFEVMQRCESPKVPFKIFTSRFISPPRTIIYDNACKLHVYCLNREPMLFQESRFLWIDSTGVDMWAAAKGIALIRTNQWTSRQ